MTVLSIENVSKKYVINHKTKSNDDLRDTISRWSKNLFNKSEENYKETFWALKNINLEIKQGEILFDDRRRHAGLGGVDRPALGSAGFCSIGAS